MIKHFICAGFILFLCHSYSDLWALNKNIHKSSPFCEYSFVKDSSLYKKISPRQLQKSTSLSGIEIIVPDEPEWKTLGKSLQGTIEKKTNISSALSLPDQEKFTKGWAGNTILLGHLGNNKQMARLYGMRMSYTDAIYPGKGGYQLLTLTDPFGLGGNTVMIAASDIEGARLAVDRLLSILKEQKDLVIPWLFEVKLPNETKSYFNGRRATDIDARSLNLKADALLTKLQPIKDKEDIADDLLAVIAGIKLYGEYYQLTANPVYGEVYSKLLKGYAQFVNRYPSDAIYQLNVRKNMWIYGEKIFQNWSVLEASPFSALYLTCKANAIDNYLVHAEETAPRWNHEIFPAMSLVGSCDYFEKYHHIPEALTWKKLGDRIFTGNTSNISMDEGSDYLAHIPMI